MISEFLMYKKKKLNVKKSVYFEVEYIILFNFDLVLSLTKKVYKIDLNWKNTQKSKNK